MLPQQLQFNSIPGLELPYAVSGDIKKKNKCLLRDYSKGHTPMITTFLALTQLVGILSLFGIMDLSGSLMKPMDLFSK